jgi:DNA-binding transcriptional LysR family regulator
MIDLRRLRHFVSVAEHLHFGRAAAALSLSQPPLSRSIRALEEELGAALFARTKRKVTLTTAGAALLPEARQLLRQVEALRHGAERLAAGEIGNLALGFISTATYNVLPRLLSEFHGRYPGVRLALQEATSDVQLRALRAGEIDLGLVVPPVEGAGLSYVPVHRDRLVAALPAAQYAKTAQPMTLKSLAQAPFILFPRTMGIGLYDATVSYCRRAGFSPRIEQEAIQMQTIVSLVSAGMGVALVPASLMHLKRSGVVYRPLAEKSPLVETGLAWKTGNDSPSLAAFLALARRLYRKRNGSPAAEK